MTESKVEAPASAIQAKAESFTSNAYIGVSTINDLNSDHLASKKNNVADTPSVPFLLGIDGNASLNASDVHKDNQILLGTYTLNNNLGTDLQFAVNGQDSVLATSKKYGNIGQVMLTQKDPHTINAYLKVSSNKNFTGQVDIAFKMPRALCIGSYVPNLPVEFKGMTKDNPLIATLTLPNSASAKFQFNMPAINKIQISNGTFLSGEAPVGKFTPWIQSSTTLNQNINKVYQVTGDNLPKTIDGFWDPALTEDIFVHDANDNITTDQHNTNWKSLSNTKVQLADNLSAEEVIKQTPLNKFGFSKQADGSWLIGWNMSPSATQVSQDQIDSVVKENSELYNFSSEADKPRILANTKKYYAEHNNIPSVIGIDFMLSRVAGADTNILVSDVTPNATHAAPIETYLSLATGDANANLQARIMYQFVDDDNNGLAVGQPVTLTGKTGDVVNPHLSVPVGYELVPGQTLPGNYTLKDSNVPVIIHLKHKTGSAVVNTPASQTDEDTSSTPATKVNDDSNKQNDQSNKDQQEQTKNDDQDQNKLKNDSDKADPANKNNDGKSTNDSQKQKTSNVGNQPQETEVKVTKTASQSPTITQTQLPQTNSENNNAKIVLGSAALAGSFAAMFAMNKRRKKD